MTPKERALLFALAAAVLKIVRHIGLDRTPDHFTEPLDERLEGIVAAVREEARRP